MASPSSDGRAARALEGGGVQAVRVRRLLHVRIVDAIRVRPADLAAFIAGRLVAADDAREEHHGELVVHFVAERAASAGVEHVGDLSRLRDERRIAA